MLSDLCYEQSSPLPGSEKGSTDADKTLDKAL